MNKDIPLNIETCTYILLIFLSNKTSKSSIVAMYLVFTKHKHMLFNMCFVTLVIPGVTTFFGMPGKYSFKLVNTRSCIPGVYHQPSSSQRCI